MDALEVLKHLEKRISERKMYNYKPYGHPDTLCPDGRDWAENASKEESPWSEWSNKPWQLDFHNAGKDHQERMMMAANRVGKTQSAAPEVAFHMTGEYPDWWEGRRFDKPVLVWTGSPTNETSRDIVQKALLGGTDKETLGTGWIPKERIIGKPKSKQAGISDVVDSFKVRHISGGVSTCIMKTYEQGWRKWQGTEPEVVWLDEEPEDNETQGRIYTEALTRLLTSHGIMMVTFTPLLGVTKLVEHFQNGGVGVYLDTATWDDAPHLNLDERNRLKTSYPEHEQEARTKGVPMMGEGRVFQISEDDIKVAPFEIPHYFARIKGIDFGIDHPAGFAEIAWDRDKDIIYIIKTWKKRNATAEEHSMVINGDDPWVPVSWPHDGTTREKSNGKMLKSAYVDHGVRMLSFSARYSNDKGGSQPVEPIIMEVDKRMRDGGLKVFSTCTDFFDEFRNYHRKNGQLTKTKDDVLKSSFYAIMMRRYAKATHRTAKKAPVVPLMSMRR